VAANPNDRVVELRATLSADNTDYRTDLADPAATNPPYQANAPLVFTRRVALQSDLEVFHYSTDHADGTAGAFVYRDLNRDGNIQPPLSSRRNDPHVGSLNPNGTVTQSMLPQETQKFSNIFTAEFGGTTARNARGPAFDPPWDFDSLTSSNEGFITLRSPLSLTGGVTAVPPMSWVYGTLGGCGFQTQTGGRAGVWHAGRGIIDAFNTASPCPSYVAPGSASTPAGYEVINDALKTPVINKVNQARDAQGFDFQARFTRFSWNENIELGDANAKAFTGAQQNLDWDNHYQGDFYDGGYFAGL
jgi:hypothetical protein